MEECDEFSTITPGTVVYVQEGTDVRGYRSVSYHGTVIEVLKGGYFKVRKHSVDSTKVVRMEHGNHLKPPRFSSYDVPRGDRKLSVESTKLINSEKRKFAEFKKSEYHIKAALKKKNKDTKQENSQLKKETMQLKKTVNSLNESLLDA